MQRSELHNITWYNITADLLSYTARPSGFMSSPAGDSDTGLSALFGTRATIWRQDFPYQPFMLECHQCDTTFSEQKAVQTVRKISVFVLTHIITQAAAGEPKLFVATVLIITFIFSKNVMLCLQLCKVHRQLSGCWFVSMATKNWINISFLQSSCWNFHTDETDIVGFVWILGRTLCVSCGRNTLVWPSCIMLANCLCTGIMTS